MGVNINSEVLIRQGLTGSTLKRLLSFFYRVDNYGEAKVAAYARGIQLLGVWSSFSSLVEIYFPEISNVCLRVSNCDIFGTDTGEYGKKFFKVRHLFLFSQVMPL